jgi:sensor histidine kinase YesM
MEGPDYLSKFILLGAQLGFFCFAVLFCFVLFCFVLFCFSRETESMKSVLQGDTLRYLISCCAWTEVNSP